MKNTIKTDERIFMVHHNFNMGRVSLCNIEGLEEVVRDSKSVKKIEHLWNDKFIRVSKKDLKGMLEAQDLNAEFLKLV